MDSVPFFRPPAELRAGLEAMNAAYLAGHATQGPEVAGFEAALAERFGVEPELVVGTSSCTEALTIALAVLGERRAVVPALTWNATANAPRNLGMEVVLADVDEHACLAADALPSGGVVLPVSLYGNEFDRSLLERRAIVDGAQALELGAYAEAFATCFSFHAVKSLPLGQGGAAVFAEREAADEARRVAQHGFSFGRGPRTQVTSPAYRAFMIAPIAAMGTALLPHVDGWAARRAEVGRSYAEAFAGLPQVARAERDAWHMFVLLPDDRDRLREHLADRGVESAAYYTALPDQPAWRGPRCERAEWLGRRATALPLHPTLTDAEVARVTEAVLTWPGWTGARARPPAAA
ncbi:MAG: DegT/DnrJ/EryC1/StrS aminotransferase family protein [Actinomycetota bacterium]|nr:DegT/DnrJ/EryC1/StrS aminotransferase family protein [Actinomycetota bacterium]